MQFNKFKLSAIALAVAGIPTVANAALYSVERLDNASSDKSAFATAISSDGSKIAVEVLNGPVGLDYSQELPYMVDYEHFINSVDDLISYCDNNLNYNTCDTWADERWYGLKAGGAVCDSSDYDAGQCLGGLKKEVDAWNDGFTSNSTATVNGSSVNPFTDTYDISPQGTPDPNSTNVVVNSVTDGGIPVGASSSPYYENNAIYARAFQRRGFYGDAELMPPSSATGVIPGIGQTNAKGVIDAAGKTIVFGSASVAVMADVGNENKVPEGSGLGGLGSCSTTLDYSDRACQYIQFANQAAVWFASSTSATDAKNAKIIASFPSGTTGHTYDSAQASVNSAALVSGATEPTMVGFSTYDDSDFYARAVKFTPTTTEDFTTCLTALETDASKRCWTMSLIPGIEIRQGGNIVYRYTQASDINESGVVVGTVKNARLDSGSYAENVFINQGTSTQILGSGQSSLFFKGYNATAAAINNSNELVGKVDVETNRDRERRQRGYIYGHGSNFSADFDGQRGWSLDDLTNGAAGANEFRIAEAFDIADNGDIAASAFYCAGGYSSTAHDALCNGEEELVAVKLTRQSGDITPRPYEEKSITRSGGGLGVIGLGLLAFAGFWRRRK